MSECHGVYKTLLTKFWQVISPGSRVRGKNKFIILQKRNPWNKFVQLISINGILSTENAFET